MAIQIECVVPGEEGKMPNIELALVICNPGENREKVVAALSKCGLSAICCSNLQEARTPLSGRKFKVILCSEALSGDDFHAILREVKTSLHQAPVIVISRVDGWESYLKALADGAFDYIVCPPNPAETERIIWSALTETIRTGKATQAMA